MKRPWLTAVGLMTGTSMDGVDAAWIETDGERVRRHGGICEPFAPDERATLKSAVAGALKWGFEGPEPNVFAAAEELIHARCLAATQKLMARIGKVDIIGLHGQTVLHRAPAPGRPGATRQLANAEALARETGVPVAYDFRADDIAAGGQGAPLAPVYHAALLRETGLERPLSVLNVGGVANITWWDGDDGLIGFDTGPGNGPLDEWVEARAGLPFDEGGRIAATGAVDERALAQLLADPYFAAPPPKSLDRHAFDVSAVDGLSVEDGAATLTAFAAGGVAEAFKVLPDPPHAVVVAGGGGRNPTLMGELRKRLPCGVLLAGALGWELDTLEAELMAYLAVRTRHALPITFPGTTGAPKPLAGGKIAEPY